jgi:hypothetical protein
MDFSIHRHLVGLLGWGISPTQSLYRNTGQHNTETRRHTSIPRAEIEPAISMFKRSWTVHALDRSAIETGRYLITSLKCLRYLIKSFKCFTCSGHLNSSDIEHRVLMDTTIKDSRSYVLREFLFSERFSWSSSVHLDNPTGHDFKALADFSLSNAKSVAYFIDFIVYTASVIFLKF